jgi:hypothetical protein
VGWWIHLSSPAGPHLIPRHRIVAHHLDDRRSLRQHCEFHRHLISFVFDLLTFATLLFVFHADEATFQTTWFIISLLAAGGRHYPVGLVGYSRLTKG